MSQDSCVAGKPLDIALKKSLWAILSSKMVVLKDLGGTSYSEEARWRKEQWLPPKSGHSKRELLQHLWKARVALRHVLRACAKACNLLVPAKAKTTNQPKARRQRAPVTPRVTNRIVDLLYDATMRAAAPAQAVPLLPEEFSQPLDPADLPYVPYEVDAGMLPYERDIVANKNRNLEVLFRLGQRIVCARRSRPT